jgi:putative transposase
VRLCTSDAHDGLRQAIATVLGCPWQRCSVHCLRDMLGHASKAQQPTIAAAIRGTFQAASLEEARQRLVEVVDRLQPVAPKVAGLLEAAEAELLAFYQLPREHWSKLRSTNPLERVNREVGRRTDVVGSFPNDAALLRLAGALLIEQNDEWLVARRYLSQESLGLVLVDEPAAQEVAQLTPALSRPRRSSPTPRHAT